MKPWYQSLTMKALIVSALIHILTMLGVAEEVASKAVSDAIEALLPFIGLLLDAIAAYGRSRAKSPLAATKAGAAKSLLVLALVAPVLALTMSGCASTREAYGSADTVDEYAYVAAEHYAALVHEARLLKEKSTTPAAAVVAMQAAAAKAQPAVLKLRALRDAYTQMRSAQNEQDLQKAVDEAVLLIADLVREVNKARGEDR